MNDRIEIRALRVLGHHGALEGEQDRAQPFEVDLDIETDLAPAARSDDLAATVDYGTIVEIARRVVAERRFRLLEALAGAIAAEVLTMPGVDAVTVTVRKLRPPVEADVASTGVLVRRERDRAAPS
jgi:dihydroneopterin aldolase